MKRSPLRRSEPLKRSAPLRRSRPSDLEGVPLRRWTRLAPINRERRAARLAAQFGPQADLCRWGPCQACKRRGPCDPHHEPPRSCGGIDKDTCALCRPCHRERHARGRRAFEQRLGVNLGALVLEMRRKRGAV